MPKQVIDNLLYRLKREICANFKRRDRFFTVKEISRRFGVSYVTAFRAAQALRKQGILTSRRGQGLYIKDMAKIGKKTQSTIALLSRHMGSYFNNGFLRGVEEVANPKGISVELVEAEFSDPRSILFGDYIAGLRADGVIAISFEYSALAFYRAMVLGVDLVADIALNELPQLPVVQTDNFRHGKEAALLMAQKGYREALAISPTGDRAVTRGFFVERVNGFREGAAESGMKVTVVCFNEPQPEMRIQKFFNSFGPRKAVFSADLGCNWTAASAFTKNKISLSNDNLVAYDGQAEFFVHGKMPAVTTVGPSLKEIGRGLADKLIDKWETGRFREPMVEMI
jgi:DNA-binding LacI/PurR family transcriptional regulator